MKILILAVCATFLAGVSFTLMVVQGFVGTSPYVGQVSLYVALCACILGGWAMVLESARRERGRAERIAKMVARAILDDHSIARLHDR